MCAGLEATFRSEKSAQLGGEMCKDGRFLSQAIRSSHGGILRGDGRVHQGRENQIQGRC